MYIEVSVWKHTFDNYVVESADCDAKTVWNEFCQKTGITGDYVKHTCEDTGKMAVIKVEFE